MPWPYSDELITLEYRTDPAQLLDLAPQDKIAAYWREAGCSRRAGTTLARANL